MTPVVMMQMITPAHTDSRGYAYGGSIMAWVDVCAGIAAGRHAGNPCVTASVDSVHFLNPIQKGEMVIVTARVNNAWNSSLEVGVSVESENMLTGVMKQCCHSFLTFVAIADGRPTTVPCIVPETDSEKEHFHSAQKRKDERMVFRNESAHQVISPINMPVSINHSMSETTLDASDSFAQVLEIVFPEHANGLSYCFGGQIIKWMEHCGAMAAARACRSHLLTASIDRLNFLKPIKIGDVVAIRGVISATFTHSVEVYVTVSIESRTGPPVITNDGWITFVACDEKGSLLKVRQIVAVSNEEKIRQASSLKRRKKRLLERSRPSE